VNQHENGENGLKKGESEIESGWLRYLWIILLLRSTEGEQCLIADK